MRSVSDAISMAKSLRASLLLRGMTISHSECLELVTKQFGVDSWNILSATIENQLEVPVNRFQFQQTIPILRIFSVDKATEFYLGFPGFQTDWEHRHEDELPLYTQVSRNGMILHLSEHHGDANPGATTVVWMSGLEDFHAEVIGKRYTYNRPSYETTSWGNCVQVTDPFGNGIRFSEKSA